MSGYYPEPPLFAAAARRTDPPTSHAAAKRAPVRGDKLKILKALAAGPGGQTLLAARTGLTVAAVGKRLSELRTDGHIERTGREVAAGECEYRITPRS